MAAVLALGLEVVRVAVSGEVVDLEEEEVLVVGLEEEEAMVAALEVGLVVASEVAVVASDMAVALEVEEAVLVVVVVLAVELVEVVVSEVVLVVASEVEEALEALVAGMVRAAGSVVLVAVEGLAKAQEVDSKLYASMR
uniref:Uncharacterized protein n=1 Tax=Leersia perrieri TaxID=77586 RepID=A0A0D9X353_9ORYZ